MTQPNQIDAFEKVGRNLYRTGAGYWRLFAAGITPNGCWLMAPKMRELKDIDVASGKDVYGPAEVEFEICGTVSSGRDFITLP